MFDLRREFNPTRSNLKDQLTTVHFAPLTLTMIDLIRELIDSYLLDNPSISR